MITKTLMAKRIEASNSSSSRVRLLAGGRSEVVSVLLAEESDMAGFSALARPAAAPCKKAGALTGLSVSCWALRRPGSAQRRPAM
jgi:hypothetical protein